MRGLLRAASEQLGCPGGDRRRRPINLVDAARDRHREAERLGGFEVDDDIPPAEPGEPLWVRLHQKACAPTRRGRRR